MMHLLTETNGEFFWGGIQVRVCSLMSQLAFLSSSCTFCFLNLLWFMPFHNFLQAGSGRICSQVMNIFL